MHAEACHYNALSLHYRGEYRPLAAARERHGTWTNAWRKERGDSPAESFWPALEESGTRLLLREDASFPPYLREIPHAPWGIYVQGNPELLARPAIAVVGTRRASAAGQALARTFSRALARAGLLVVSGLAFGVDAAAHEGALETGQTAAVLAGGLHEATPHSHRQLAAHIRQQGTLVSEYPLGNKPLPHRFLERNRLIAGLARGVLIVEAPLRSGSLATARFALEQNRDVFVVPGPARDPNFAGSHGLIRDGATLVTEPEHIFEALGVSAAPQQVTDAPRRPAETLILEILRARGEPLDIDKISELTNLRIQTVSQAVSMLALEGIVEDAGGAYSLK